MQLRRWYLAPVIGLTLVHLAPGCGGGEVIVGGNGGEGGGNTSTSSKATSSSGQSVSGTGTASATGSTTATSSVTTSVSSVSVSSSTGGLPTPDVCNDLVLTLVNGTPQTVQGSTVGLADDFSIACADPMGTAPDAVVNVTITSECILDVTLTTQGFDAGVAVFGGTCQAPAIGCANNGAQQDTVVDVFPAGSYSFVVDGSDGDSGPFSLTLLCEAPVCGDGFVTTGEQCDVGAGAPMDGCGDPGAPNACQFEAVNAGVENCTEANAGAAVTIGANQVLHIPGAPPYRTTIGAIDDLRSSDPMCQGIAPGGPDHVYRVVPSANGVLTATVGNTENDQAFCNVGPLAGCWDRTVYALEGTCSVANQIACSDDDLDGGAVEEISFPVVAGQSYYVVVDGADATALSQGLYDLRLELE